MQKVNRNGIQYRLTLKGWLLASLIVLKEDFKRTRLAVWYYRRRYPHDGTCYHCGLPWSAVKDDIHMIDFPGDRDGEGFFTCCEYCWNKMSWNEKMDSVKNLYLRWRELGDTRHLLGEMYHAFELDEGVNELYKKVDHGSDN